MHCEGDWCREDLRVSLSVLTYVCMYSVPVCVST